MRTGPKRRAPDGVAPNCKYCDNPCAPTSKRGKPGYFRSYCNRCDYGIKRAGFPYGLYKKNRCEACGFVAIHSCQLDVDHIDKNKRNNDLSNLRTLCANCHRLKTWTNKEHYTDA